MLLNKLTLITAILLVTLALAAGGTSLTFWAHATEPANQKKDAENLTERSNRAEAAKEDLPTDPNRLTGEDTKGSSEPAETQQGVLQPTKLYRGYSFTASPTGNVAFAYNLETQEVKAVRLNATEEHPIKVTPAVGPRGGRGAASRGAEDHPGRRLQHRVGQVVAPGPGRTGQRSRPADAPGPWRARVPGRSLFLYVPLKDIHVGSCEPPGHYAGTAPPGDAHGTPARGSWRCVSRGRRSPASPSTTSSRASGRPWTWTNRPAESSSRWSWAPARRRTRSVDLSMCTIQRHPSGIVWTSMPTTSRTRVRPKADEDHYLSSQMRTSPTRLSYPPALTSDNESGENATHSTGHLWPVRFKRSLPEEMSQSFTSPTSAK